MTIAILLIIGLSATFAFLVPCIRIPGTSFPWATLVSIRLDCPKPSDTGHKVGAWVFIIRFGHGAGYKRGRCAFLARQCKGAPPLGDRYMRRPWQWCLWTRNASRVPYPY